MKEIMWTKKNILIFGVALVFAVLMYVYGTLNQHKDAISILSDCEYTVGTVETFFIPNNPPRPYLRYKHFVDGVEFEGRQYYRFPPRVVEKGDKYIVAYSNKNVKHSVLLFDYPIREDGDFERYLERFKISPPSVSGR